MTDDNHKELDQILSEIKLNQIPGEYILVGIIRTPDNREFEVSGEIIDILFRNKETWSEEDNETIEDLLEFLEDDRAEIDVIINIQKLKEEIIEKVNDLIENHIRKDKK